MAALDFPASPTINQIFSAPNGATYKWDGEVWTGAGAGSGASPVGPAGGDLTGSYPDPAISAGKVLWTHLGQQVYANLARSGMQSIPNATGTAMTWTGATLDVGGAWNAGQPTRLTSPATGIYLAGAAVAFAASASGNLRRLTIERPSAANLLLSEGRPSGADNMVTLSGLISLNAGEFITCSVYQDSGGVLNCGDNGWAFPARFWLIRIA